MQQQQHHTRRYFTHIRDPGRCPANFSAGLDYRANMELVTTANTTYSANDFSDQVARLANRTALLPSAEQAPLFIYLPFQSVHGP